MTKKSLGRQKRDELKYAAEKEGVDQHWERLEEVYVQQKGLFAEYYNMAQMIIDPQVMPHLADIGKTNTLVKLLASDSKALKEELDATYAKHQGRTGTADEEEGWFEITMLHQDYAMMMSKHQQTILPVMLELTEHLQEALRRREVAMAEARAVAANFAAQAEPA